MSQDVVISAKKREEVGKKAAKKFRQDGLVPAVIQEPGKESVHLLINGLAMQKAFAEAGKSQPIDITIDGKKHLALIKQIEFVPLKPEIQHVVFQALKQNQAVDAEVPIHIVGEIPAENNRHVLLRTLETVEIRALPRDLPEALEVPGANLVEIDDRVTVRDIKLPEGVELVEILTNADDQEKQEEFLDQPIALVKDASVVEVDEGVELEEGASEGDAVEAENGGDGGESSEESGDKPEQSDSADKSE